MDRQAMQRLKEECAALGGLTGDAEILAAWTAHDDAFHEAIALSCAHGRLASDILRYRRIHYALNSIRMKAALVPQTAAEHGAILRALARRDPEEARRAMNLHLVEWQAYYTNLFGQRR
jgi:DNA-binding GntR family transcriptional regulator